MPLRRVLPCQADILSAGNPDQSQMYGFCEGVKELDAVKVAKGEAPAGPGAHAPPYAAQQELRPPNVDQINIARGRAGLTQPVLRIVGSNAVTALPAGVLLPASLASELKTRSFKTRSRGAGQ